MYKLLKVYGSHKTIIYFPTREKAKVYAEKEQECNPDSSISIIDTTLEREIQGLELYKNLTDFERIQILYRRCCDFLF